MHPVALASLLLILIPLSLLITSLPFSRSRASALSRGKRIPEIISVPSIVRVKIGDIWTTIRQCRNERILFFLDRICSRRIQKVRRIHGGPARSYFDSACNMFDSRDFPVCNYASRSAPIASAQRIRAFHPVVDHLTYRARS